jgi:HSP20 family molecular chaperone IbpA
MKMSVTTKEIEKKEAQLREGVERTRARRVYIPSVDIIEREEDIVLVADMPGVDDKSLDIMLEKDTLTIDGKVEETIPEGHRRKVSEYGIGDYHRVFTLSDEIDKEKINATVRHGVLRLTLPKAEAVKTRKIPVRAEA